MPMPMPMAFMPIPVPAGPSTGVPPNPNPNVQPGSVGNTSTSNPAANLNPGAGRPQPQYPGFPPGMGVGLGMQAFTVPVAGGVMIGGFFLVFWLYFRELMDFFLIYFSLFRRADADAMGYSWFCRGS